MTRRRLTALIVAGLLLVASLAVVLIANDRARALCETRATARADIVAVFTDLIDVLDPDRSSPRTQEFERRMFLHLPPLDC